MDISRSRSSCSRFSVSLHTGSKPLRAAPRLRVMLSPDIRFAFRSLRKSPGFAVVAILTIALGLGANTAIFSFLDGVLLKRLEYPEPERLVQLWEKPPGGLRNGISALNFQDWQRQSTSFTAMAATTGKTATLTGRGEPHQLRLSL